MIIRPKPGLFDIFFAVKGSILLSVIGRLITIALITLVAVSMDWGHRGVFAQIGAIPFTLIGLALSIFTSFRNNACYDRWWEGRKLWGQLIIGNRSLARQTALLPQQERGHFLHGLCAFSAGLAARLREEDEVAAITRWSQAQNWAGLPNPTDAALRAVGTQCLHLMQQGTINPVHYSVLEAQLTELGHVQGGCERIATTPLPFSYSLLLHRTAYIFCVALPFALADSLGWWTFLPSILISYTFFGLDALGDELEDPFGTEANDLPLSALLRIIERDHLSALGVEDLPPALVAQSHLLS